MTWSSEHVIRRAGDQGGFICSPTISYLPALKPRIRSGVSIEAGKAVSISESGAVDMISSADVRVERVYLSWIIGDLINALGAADFLRSRAGVGDVEFAVEIEIGHWTANARTGSNLRLVVLDDAGSGGSAITTPLKTPRYEITLPGELDLLLTMVVTDLTHAAGSPFDTTIEFVS